MTVVLLLATCRTVTSQNPLCISDKHCCRRQGSFGVNLAPGIERFCHPCSNSAIPIFFFFFLFFLFFLFFFFFFSSSYSFSLLVLLRLHRLLLNSVVELGFQYNLPPFPTLSPLCPSDLYFIP